MGIARPCTKWCVQVRDVRELPRRINEAFKIATSGRPGPVIVDLPKDVTASICNEAVPTIPQLPGLSSEALEGHLPDDADDNLAKAAELLNNAKRPIIFAGQGVQQGHATAQLMGSLSVLTFRSRLLFRAWVFSERITTFRCRCLGCTALPLRTTRCSRCV